MLKVGRSIFCAGVKIGENSVIIITYLGPSHVPVKPDCTRAGAYSGSPAQISVGFLIFLLWSLILGSI